MGVPNFLDVSYTKWEGWRLWSSIMAVDTWDVMQRTWCGGWSNMVPAGEA